LLTSIDTSVTATESQNNIQGGPKSKSSADLSINRTEAWQCD